MDCSPPGSSAHGFPRQEYWSGFPFPPTADLTNPRIEPMSPASAGRLFTTLSLVKLISSYLSWNVCSVLRLELKIWKGHNILDWIEVRAVLGLRNEQGLVMNTVVTKEAFDAWFLYFLLWLLPVRWREGIQEAWSGNPGLSCRSRSQFLPACRVRRAGPCRRDRAR